MLLGLPVLFGLITACTGNARQEAATGKEETPAKISQSPPNSPAEAVLSFLLWYQANREKLYAINLVHNNPPSGNDTTKVYRVNFEGAKAFMAYFEQSGLVSEEYLQYFRDYFRKADHVLLTEPQYDGPPAYFDADLVMLAQDFPTQEAELQAALVQQEQIDGNNAQVVLIFEEYGMKLYYKLTQKNGKWLVSAIENLGGA